MLKNTFFGIDRAGPNNDCLTIMKAVRMGPILVMTPATLEDLAQAYVELFNGPANAHGQYVHPTFGHSHRMLAVMNHQFGAKETMEAIQRIFDAQLLIRLQQEGKLI